MLWKHRGFITTSGKPIQHCAMVKHLLESIMFPSELSVVKCEAHTGGSDSVSQGNALADFAAKQAALNPSMMVLQGPKTVQSNLLPVPSLNDVTILQNSADGCEKAVWSKNGCTPSESGLWLHPDGRIVAPRSLLHSLCRLAHTPSHVGKGGMNHVIQSQWFAPGHTTATEQYCNRCLICAQHARGNIKLAKHDHLPPPSGPFVNMQIDFVHMPPKQGNKYMLVCVDMFSKWVEVFPTRKDDMSTVVKCLMRDVIPRFGLPQSINSDRGTHFTGQIVKKDVSKH